MKIPRAAAIHDLSGIGRCSLTAAIPILSAMGIQVCPFPTAVLSNQTGYLKYEIADLTDRMEAFGACWAPWYSSFDAVYTGFLSNPKQAEIRRKEMPHTFFLIPGYGAQGGTADDLRVCFDRNGRGGIVNSSRGILCAYRQEKYAGLSFDEAAYRACIAMKEDLNRAIKG